MRNISVKLFRIWSSSSGGDVILKISYLEFWRPLPLFSGADSFMQFLKRASLGTFMKSYFKFGSVVQDEL